MLVSLSLVPFTVVGLILLKNARDELSQQAFDHLDNIRDSKKAQLQRHVDGTRADIRVLSQSSHIGAALDAFDSVVYEGEIDRAEFEYFESIEYGSAFRNFISEFGYYDLMLANREGDIVYSVKRESDLAANLFESPMRESLLGAAFQRGLKGVVHTDFELYGPSGGQLMSFLIASLEAKSDLVSGNMPAELALRTGG